MSVHQKLGANLESKVVQKLNLEKNIFNKKWSPRLIFLPKLYIPSTPNNSNETHTFMCLGRTGRFGQR